MLKLIVATGEDLIGRIQEQGGQWQASRLTNVRGMQCVTVDPHQPRGAQLLLAGIELGGIMHSEDGGER